MLEILGMVFLFRKLKDMLANKGRGAGLAALGPVLWIVGEIGGAVVGGVICAIQGEENMGIVYGLAIGGAIAGAALAFLIVYMVPGMSLTCPMCLTALPPGVDRNYARLQCRTCREDLKVMNGTVVSQ